VHDLYVRHALALLDHLGLHRVMVVGTSTGGTVAIDLALTAPDRVARMVIGACEASTGGDPYLLAPWPSEVARLAQECQSLPADEERIRRFLAAMVYDERALPEGLAGQMYNWRLDQPEHADAWSRSTSVPAGNLSKLAAIRQDVLIIHGRFDRMVPLEGAVRLLNYLPSSDLIALNRCGHWPAMERPDEFATYVMNFM
jgi:pimeloyl-ACP methyl ester carboxylesterase